MPETARVSIEIAASPGAVFAALTTPAALETWFAEHAVVDPAAKRFEFWGTSTPGNPRPDAAGHSVTAWDEGTRLAFEWVVDGERTLVTITIGRTERRTVATVTHEGAPRTHADFWCIALQNLQSFVEDGAVAWLPDYSTPSGPELRFTIDAAAEPAAVYDALIRPEQLNRWIADAATVEAFAGGTYDFGWPEDDGRPLKLVDLVPSERVSFAWADPNVEGTVVTWELEGSNGGTRITLIHSGFSDVGPESGYYNGWADFVVRLKHMVEKGPSWRGPRWERIPASVAG